MLSLMLFGLEFEILRSVDVVNNIVIMTTVCLKQSGHHNTFYTVMFVGGQRHGGDKVAGGKMQHGKRRPRNELREKSQIVKERTKRSAKKEYQLHRTEQRQKRKGTKPTFKRKQ